MIKTGSVVVLSWHDVLVRELRCEAIATMWRLERGWSESKDVSLPRFGPSDGGKSLRPALCVLMMMMISITRVLFCYLYSRGFLICLSLMNYPLPLGVPFPSLYKLKGRLTYTVLLGLGLGLVSLES